MVLIDNLRVKIQKHFLFPFMRLFLRSVEIKGLDNLSQINQQVIFIANHTSHADTGIFLYSLPEHLRKNLSIAAASDYFYRNKFIGFVCTLILGTFSFERNNARKSLMAAQKQIEAGHSLLIYPEGTRSQDGFCHEFKPGFAFLARKYNLPIIPVYIEGGNSILPKGSFYPKESTVQVYFGEEILLPKTKIDKQKIANSAREKVINLAKTEAA